MNVETGTETALFLFWEYFRYCVYALCSAFQIQIEAKMYIPLQADAEGPIHYPVKTSKLPITALYFRQFFTYGVDKKRLFITDAKIQHRLPF
jgi:hypothetical protein